MGLETALHAVNSVFHMVNTAFFMVPEALLEVTLVSHWSGPSPQKNKTILLVT